MRLLRNWFRFNGQRASYFSRKYAIQASMESILVSIFSIGLLRLSTGIYEATSLTAAKLVNHLE